MDSEDFLRDEFWWLGELGAPTQGRVSVARSRWTHLQEAPHFQRVAGQLDIASLADWATSHQWENVHRTLEVFGGPHGREPMVGPIVIDVDVAEDHLDQVGGPSNHLLALAKSLTLAVLGYLDRAGTREHQRRVYFSGQKGFHIHYVLPSKPYMHRRQARDYLGPGQDSWRNEMRTLRRALDVDRGSQVMIDNVHEYVRLRGSVNRWGPSGSGRQHRVMRISENELSSITSGDLWQRSQLNQ